MGEVIGIENKRNHIEKMKNAVLAVFIQYYKDMHDSGINIPYFIRARDEYKKRVKSLKDLKFLYKKIEYYKLQRE